MHWNHFDNMIETANDFGGYIVVHSHKHFCKGVE